MGISTLACGLGYSTLRRKMPHVHLVPLNVGYDSRLDAKTSERGQAGSSVILAMTTRIPLYESTDRAYIGAMSFLSGTIDAR